MSSLFFSNYANNSDYFKSNPESGNLRGTIRGALTMHAIKDVRYAYRIYFSVLKSKIERQRNKILRLHSFLERKHKNIQNSRNEFLTKNASWDSIANFKKLHQTDKEVPIVYMKSTSKIEILFLFQEIIRYLHGLIQNSYLIKNIPTVYRHLSTVRGLAYSTDLQFEVNKRCSLLQLRGFRKFLNIQSRIIELDNQAPVTFVIPLYNKRRAFDRFLKMWISEVMEKNVHLLFTISNKDNDLTAITEMISRASQTLPSDMSLGYTVKSGAFSRGPILNFGAKFVRNDHIMCFMDIDLQLKKSTFNRIRANTIKGKQVYFPIMFSQYDSNFNDILEGHNSNSGYWRDSSYGQVCLYKEDYLNSLKLTETIYEWGKEDLEFAEQIINKRKLNIFRSPDVGITHIFHPIKCDRINNVIQRDMCTAVKHRTFASRKVLSKTFYSWSHLLNINQDKNQK